MSWPGWIVTAVVLAIIITAWVTFTATRLDRLHARVDAAQAALDAQLVRRAASVGRLAESCRDIIGPASAARLIEVARTAMQADRADREVAENAVGKASNELADLAAAVTAGSLAQQSTTRGAELEQELREVADSAMRVVMSRRFYNDAVRDTRSLRAGRMPRIMHLAGHRELPQFFDIDDSTRWSLPVTPFGGSQ